MSMKPISLANLTRALNTLKEWFVMKKDAVLSVNGVEPDDDGDVYIESVEKAENFESEYVQQSDGTFIERTTGGEASISDGDGWLMRVRGKRVHTGYVAESLNMTVSPMERQEGEPITATIDRDTFVAYVDESGTITLTYSTSWSADPTAYGITVTGTPIAGDVITVVYVKEERGTITQSNPQTFVSTGWNLYNNTLGYARVLKYSTEYGFVVSGAYTALSYASTPTGEQQSITVTDGHFSIPADGYVFVTGGGATTAIWMEWMDWGSGYSGNFMAYTQTVVDLTGVMSQYFPNGLLQVGGYQDEINANTGVCSSWVERMAYTGDNLAAAIATGRTYEYDQNYIYLARASAVTNNASITGEFKAYDHGMEFFTGTSVEVETQTIYGVNLKNRLERDVLTISQQTLTNDQKAQVRTNIGAIGEAALAESLESKANLFQVRITVPKNNGTASVTYSSLGLRDGRVYLITAMSATNNAWRYAGVLYIQSTRTMIASIESSGSPQLTASADGTKITFTNINAGYDAAIIVQAIGY